jgi:broad specificity phosphatase PhoE
MVSSVDGPSRSTRVLLLRHGRVAEQWESRIYGGMDVPLSAAGCEEAKRVARLLADVQLDVVVSSGLARAEYTAALLRRPRGLKRRDEEAFREIERGVWRGTPIAEMDPEEWAAWQREPSRTRPRGGESLGDLAQRVLPRMRALVGELDGRTLALVSHGWVMRVILCEVLGLPLDASTTLAMPTSALVVLDWPLPVDAPGSAPVLAGFGIERLPDPGLQWTRRPRPG